MISRRWLTVVAVASMLLLVATACRASPTTGEAGGTGIDFDAPQLGAAPAQTEQSGSETTSQSLDELVPITRTMNVLFVGNSFTYYHDMPETVAALARANGTAITYSTIVAGGANLTQHVQDPLLGQALASGVYDVVVLQEQSMFGAIQDDPSYPTMSTVIGLADLAARSGTRVVLFQTWAYRNGSQELDLYTYEAMQRAVIENYAAISAATGATVAPVGATWWDARTFLPEVELYDPDGSHPSEAGSYLAALVITSTVTNAPVGQVVAYDAIGETAAIALRDVTN